MRTVRIKQVGGNCVDNPVKLCVYTHTTSSPKYVIYYRVKMNHKCAGKQILPVGPGKPE